MRKFSKFEIATIKRTAQSVNPMVSKKAKLKEQIDALQAEYDQLDTMQEQYEASIKTMTGGYGTEDLVEKVIENNPKAVEDYKGGKQKAIGSLIGMVMRETRGKADAKSVEAMLIEKLK